MSENKACMYLKLSKEDGDSIESNSILNQINIINEYAKKNKINIVKEFIDDGYSGANFSRTQFNKMINSIKDK